MIGKLEQWHRKKGRDHFEEDHFGKEPWNSTKPHCMVWISRACVGTTPHTSWGLSDGQEGCSAFPGDFQEMWLCTWETACHGKRVRPSRCNPGICSSTLGTPCSVLNWCGAWWPKEWILLPFHSFFKLVDFLKVGYVRALNKERNVSVNSALHCKSGQTRIYRWLKGTERTAGPIPSIYILEKVRPKNLLRAHKYHCRETQDQVLLLLLLTVLNQASC